MYTHLIPMSKNFGRVCHFSEDPIERTHKEDKNLERAFLHIRNLTPRKNSKIFAIQMQTHRAIVNIIRETNEMKKRNLQPNTLSRKTVKAEEKQLNNILFHCELKNCLFVFLK